MGIDLCLECYAPARLTRVIAQSLWFSDFAKASIFGLARCFSWQAQDQVFFVAGARHGSPYDLFSWQALYGSTNRKVGNA